MKILKLVICLLLITINPLLAQNAAPTRILSSVAEVFSPLIPDLRLRDAPGAAGTVIRLLGKDETLVALPDPMVSATIDTVNGNWVKVKTPKGDSGWCFDGFLKYSGIGNQTISGDFLHDGRTVTIEIRTLFNVWPLPLAISVSDYEKKILPKVKNPKISELLGEFYRLTGGSYKLPHVDSEDYLFLPDYDDALLGRFFFDSGYRWNINGPGDVYCANFEYDQDLVMSVDGRVLSTQKSKGRSVTGGFMYDLQALPASGLTLPDAFAFVQFYDPEAYVELTKTRNHLFSISKDGLRDTGLSVEYWKAEGEGYNQIFIFPSDLGGEKNKLIITDRDGEGGFTMNEEKITLRYTWNGKAFTLTK